MGKPIPLPLPDGSYSDDAKSFTDQDVYGFIPTRAEQGGTRSNLILPSVPGLKEYATVPDVTRQRGARNVEGRLYFVAGTSLCQLEPGGSIAILGTIPGIGRVSITHNQIENGNQVFITNGTQGYIWNTRLATLTQITDSGFLGGLGAEFIGARFLSISPDRKLFQNSDLADGLEWNSSEDYAGESDPDRIRAIKQINNEVVLLSESSTEHFAYTGTTNAIFENKGISIARGCSSTHAVSVMDNALYFIGNDGSGYEKRGYELLRITTHAIEQQWSRCDPSKAFSMVWEDRGHKVWYVTFPDGHTWGFDAATRRWHRRESYGMDRWRISWLQPWDDGDGRAWYAGDAFSGKVYRLVWKYPLEGANPLPRGFSPGVLHQDANRFSLNAIRLDVEVGPSVSPSTVNSLVISGSLDDCAVGDVIDFTYSLGGGAYPASWAVTAGALPDGLTLDPDTGTISGTTTTAEHDNSWTVTVTDALGNEATIDDTCYVMDMVGDPPDTLNGDPYDYTLTGTEGTAPYTFAKVSGDLPTGLSLASDGEISGTTSEDGTFVFSVTMTDDAGVTQTKAYSIGVSVDYGTIYVGSSSTAGLNVPVTIVDGNTNTVSDTVLGTTQLLLPSLSSDGTRVYVYDPLSLSYVQLSDNTLHVLVAAGGSFYLNGGGPVQCDSTDTYLWAVDFDHGLLRKIRIADGVEVATITAGADCTCITWIDAGKTILGMGTYTDQHLRRYDTVGGSFLSNIDNTGIKYQMGLAWCPDTGYVYSCGSTDEGSSYLLEYHPGGAATSSVLLPFFDQCRVAITPDGSKAYVVNITNTSGPLGRVVVIDTASQTVLTTLTLASTTPNFIAINPAGTKAYVSCSNSTLYVIDTASDIVEDAIAVGTNAYGVAIKA